MLSSLNGATRIHLTIGDPITQVKSPAAITEGFANRGHNAIMIPLQVKPADIDDFFRLARKLPNLDGMIVTVPHKPAAFRYCKTTTERARLLEVCNVMRREADGSWHGDMTDGKGFIDALRIAKFDAKGKSALQVGAGGAGSAVGLALCAEGVRTLALCDIDTAKRDRLIARLTALGYEVTAAETADPSGFDLVVNATPAGMRRDDPMPVDISRLDSRMFVADIITTPALTRLLAAAQAKGCRTQDGYEMFKAQSNFITDFLLGR